MIIKKKCIGLSESTLWKPCSDKEIFGELGGLKFICLSDFFSTNFLTGHDFFVPLPGSFVLWICIFYSFSDGVGTCLCCN